MNQQKWRRHTHVALMSRFSNVVDCQRKKCRGFSFLFDFPFYSPARFASIDSFIHSFIRLFLAFAWAASVPLLASRLWLEFYFISFPDIEPKQLSPCSNLPRKKLRLEVLGHLSNFQSHIWYCHARFFLCSVEIEKAFQWRYAFASQPFLKNVAYPWRCGQIALRAAFDKSET